MSWLEIIGMVIGGATLAYFGAKFFWYWTARIIDDYKKHK